MVVDAPEIIRTARHLGIYCRPVAWSHDWPGEALDMSGDTPVRVSSFSSNYMGIYTITVEDMVCDWEMVTMVILQKEYEKVRKEPF